MFVCYTVLQMYRRENKPKVITITRYTLAILRSTCFKTLIYHHTRCVYFIKFITLQVTALMLKGTTHNSVTATPR